MIEFEAKLKEKVFKIISEDSDITLRFLSTFKNEIPSYNIWRRVAQKNNIKYKIIDENIQ